MLLLKLAGFLVGHFERSAPTDLPQPFLGILYVLQAVHIAPHRHAEDMVANDCCRTLVVLEEPCERAERSTARCRRSNLVASDVCPYLFGRRPPPFVFVSNAV